MEYWVRGIVSEIAFVAFFYNQAVIPLTIKFLPFQAFHELQQSIFQLNASSFNAVKSFSDNWPAFRYACKPETLSPSEPKAMFRKLRYSRMDFRQYPSAILRRIESAAAIACEATRFSP